MSPDRFLDPPDDGPAPDAPSVPAAVSRQASASRLNAAVVPPPGATAGDPASLGRRERRRLETFERLVAVARAVLFTRDLRAVPVADITEAADVGKGTFFNYFSSKEQVVPELLLFNRRALADSLGRVERGEATVPEAFKDRLKQYFCPTDGEWQIYEQNLIRSLLQADVRQEFSARLLPHAEYHAALMAVGQRQGTIRRDLSAKVLGDWVFTFVIGVSVVLWIQAVPPTPQLVDHFVDVMLRMLVPASSGAATPTGADALRPRAGEAASRTSGSAKPSGSAARRRRTRGARTVATTTAKLAGAKPVVAKPTAAKSTATKPTAAKPTAKTASAPGAASRAGARRRGRSGRPSRRSAGKQR